MAKYVVATVDELPPGARKIVEIDGRSIGVFNLNGEFFALRNRCPHQGGPLCAGRIGYAIDAPTPGEYIVSRKDEMIRCPWHGWEFDLRTGQSWWNPTRQRVRQYAVTVAPGAGLHAGPYVAETFAVSVAQQYVVVTVGEIASRDDSAAVL
ncbi:MAG: Rieske (2Fe-2S) protein [Chloroflexota bacterium]